MYGEVHLLSLFCLRRTGARRRACSVGLAVLVAALSCISTPAKAQDPLLDRATALLVQRDAAGAFALLTAAEAQRAGEREFDYLLGIAALDAGHVTRAIFALERLVQLHPDHKLARAELGRAYLAAGDAEAAREQMRLAREGNVPEEAAQAINRVLGIIDQVSPTRRPQLSGFLEFGAGFDSNVNSATNLGEFAIPAFGGILFQTSPESRQQRDIFAAAAGGINAELSLSPVWKIVASANGRATVNEDVTELNTRLIDVTVAARRTAGAHSQTLALQSGTAWLGSSLYRGANGATAQWQAQLDARSQTSVFGQWSRQNYHGQEERNTDRAVLGLGYARDFSASRWLAYGSGYLVRELAADDAHAHYGHRAEGLRVGAERRVNEALTAFFELKFERRRYGGLEPFFDTARRDRQADFSLGARYLASRDWRLNAQLQRTRSASNVVLYDYARNVIQLNVQRTFP